MVLASHNEWEVHSSTTLISISSYWYNIEIYSLNPFRFNSYVIFKYPSGHVPRPLVVAAYSICWLFSAQCNPILLLHHKGNQNSKILCSYRQKFDGNV